MNWKLWLRQIDAIARLEFKRFLLARRWIGIYLVALAPVALMFFRSQLRRARFDSLDALSEIYANLFQLFEVRLGLFISCAVVFSQLFRGEILEKTLHYYLLTPARREVIAVGKYVAGVIFVATLFGISAISMYLIMYSTNPGFSSFFLEGPGLAHLFRYALVTTLATIAYGAVFLLAGLLFKNPGPATFLLLMWESFSFALPSLLQKLSVIHYLQALLPVAIDRGPFAIITEPPAAVVALPSLLIGVGLVVAAAGWFVRQAEVTYSAD
jgi:ABC-type transport system involved in multi-copper enzyme maturation permease subunit